MSRFSLPILQKFKLALTGDERDFKSPINGPNANELLIQLPGQNTVIVGDSALRRKGAFDFLVELVGISNLGDTSDCDLSRQAKEVPDIVIGKVVNFELTKGFVFPGHLADVITSGIGLLKGLPKGINLFVIRLQFDLRRKFHLYEYYSTNVLEWQIQKGEGALLHYQR